MYLFHGHTHYLIENYCNLNKSVTTNPALSQFGPFQAKM